MGRFTYLPSLHGQLTTAAQRRPMVDAYWLRAGTSQVEGPGGVPTAESMRPFTEVLKVPNAAVIDLRLGSDGKAR